MISSIALLDVAPPGGAVVTGLVLGIGVFLIVAAIAVIAFKILKRSLKMAFRVVIVVIILIVAVLAATGVFVYSIVDGMNKPRPSPSERLK